jgi:lysophospholipase L1-like esterase
MSESKIIYSVNSVNDNLPNILILGDSISIGYTPIVGEMFEDKANVWRPDMNCSSSEVYLENLEKWLDDRKWDVIHFNCGLHDVNRANNEKINREGECRVTLDEYRSNLLKIADLILASTKNAIWASTTPIPPVTVNRKIGDEVKYNEVANDVMSSKNIPINDLYDIIFQTNYAYHQALNNVHFTDEGYKLLGEHVVKYIKSVL